MTMANQGLFNLSNFADMDDNDTISMTEGTEFAPKSNATNDVSNHTTSAKVSIPGGESETPKSKPEGGEHGPTPPGGNNERPSVNAHEHGPSTPQKTELTTAQWDKAVAMLKQSFKEGVELMEMLENCTVVQETVEQQNDRYLQEAMDNAYYEAMISGPLYESIFRKDKGSVKDCVRSVNGKVKGYFKKKKIPYKPVQLYASMSKINWLNKRMWQVLGAAAMSNADAKACASELTTQYSKQLGEYKILATRCWSKELSEMFESKFKWPKGTNIVMFIVDKTIPQEFSKSVQLGGEPITEGKDCDDCDDDDCNKDDKKCPKCHKNPGVCDEKKDDKKDKKKDKNDDDDDE